MMSPLKKQRRSLGRHGCGFNQMVGRRGTEALGQHGPVALRDVRDGDSRFWGFGQLTGAVKDRDVGAAFSLRVVVVAVEGGSMMTQMEQQGVVAADGWRRRAQSYV